MSRAQQIVDKILTDERYTSSALFSDRVYRDEPILRTGAQAFGGAATPQLPATDAPRGAQTTPSPQATRPQRTAMPERYRAMRRLERTRTSWGYAYGTGGARLFFEQGKLMEDFSDDFSGTGSFRMYYPTYSEMSDYELRCYFSWRTRLRAGETPEAPVSFLFVHAYELLCGIGVEPGAEGLAALRHLRERYAGTSSAFDAHLARWTHDYVVFYGLDVHLLPAGEGSFPVAAVSTLRQAEQALLAAAGEPGGAGAQVGEKSVRAKGGRAGAAEWPGAQAGASLSAVPGMPSDAELLDALVALSRYRADRSRFFRDNRADVAEVAARVFARMVAHCHKRRKTDLVDGLFGVPTRVSYTMFPSALFWSPTPHEDVTYEVSASERYVCERGFWWRELPCKRTETNRELGALLHAIDCRMRRAYGDAHPLKERSLPKYQGKFVDEEIAALLERREAAEAARVVIDRSALGHIRRASARTQEALLTDEEREQGTGAAAPAVVDAPGDAPGECVAPATADAPADVPGKSVASATADAPMLGGSALNAGQIALLQALLAGAVPPGDALSVSLAVDAINEAFLDTLGDTVIEFDGDTPMLVEDYIADVRAATQAH